MQKEKTKLKLVSNPTSFELIIPKEVESKIRHLCSRVRDVEWSGILFYKVDGSLDDNSFKATCVDICVMDIGTSGFTEFKDSPDVASYRLEHDLYKQGIYEGLIHSHNRMATFFSSTDTETLLEEGNNLNHFLSLIVNNAGTYTARITRKLKNHTVSEAVITKKESVSYDTYENETIVLKDGETSVENKTLEKDEIIVEYFELNINKTEVVEPFKDIDDRLDDIKASKIKSSYSNIKTGDNLNFISTEEYFKDKKNEQLSLFDAYASNNSRYFYTTDNYTTKNTNENYDKNTLKCVPEDVYKREIVPIEITKTLCTQLLTGSILATSKSNIDLVSWTRKMDNLYKKRFGDFMYDEQVYYILKQWVSTMLDVIIGYSVNKKYEDTIAKKYDISYYDYNDNTAFMCLYADSMLEFLSELPDSEVKEIMIEELTNLMPKNYEKY